MWLDIFLAFLFPIVTGAIVVGVIVLITFVLMRVFGTQYKDELTGERVVPVKFFISACFFTFLISIAVMFVGRVYFGNTWWWQELQYYAEVTKDLPGS